MPDTAHVFAAYLLQRLRDIMTLSHIPSLFCHLFHRDTAAPDAQ